MGSLPSNQDWIGITPPPSKAKDDAKTGYGAGGTPLAVSHRRTFLLLIVK